MPGSIDTLFCVCGNLILLPIRLIWDLVVVLGVIALLVVWLGFLFGSVIGVVLLLIFLPEAFFLPLLLLGLVVPLWEECR